MLVYLFYKQNSWYSYIRERISRHTVTSVQIHEEKEFLAQRSDDDDDDNVADDGRVSKYYRAYRHCKSDETWSGKCSVVTGSRQRKGFVRVGLHTREGQVGLFMLVLRSKISSTRTTRMCECAYIAAR